MLQNNSMNFLDNVADLQLTNPLPSLPPGGQERCLCPLGGK